MKKLAFLYLLTLAFCVGNARNLYQQQPATEKLVLNQGAKWKVDKVTFNNVAELQQIAKAADRKTRKTLKDYHQTGTALQTGITKMVRECRMKGPDHLALHHWLEPLMELVSKLNRTGDATTAAGLYQATDAQLALFNRYFQL